MGLPVQVWACTCMHVIVLYTLSYIMYIAPRLYNGVHTRSYNYPPLLMQF